MSELNHISINSSNVSGMIIDSSVYNEDLVRGIKMFQPIHALLLYSSTGKLRQFLIQDVILCCKG